MSSVDNKSWQDLCIRVPASTGKRVAFAEDIDEACYGLSITGTDRLDRFCQIFKEDDGCRISLKLEDEVLFRLGVEALKHRASPGMGLCLADVLQRYTLTVEEKLALAYVISSAFWQFYDSQIMNRAWSSRNIWFMPQPDLRDNSELLPLKAYLSFDSEAIECDFDACEFAETRSLIHRCPRIQALAVLLLEIGLGRPLEYKTFDRQTQQLNYRYAEASEYLEELKSVTWENFAHKYIFTDAVEACLKFDVLMGKGEHSGSDEPHSLRRKLLHQRVVSHMIWLNRSFRGSNGKVRYVSKKQLENDYSFQTNESRSPSTLENKSFELEQRSHTISSLDSEDRVHAGSPIDFDKRRRPSSKDFEIGLLCALTIEADAVEALFDDYWDDGPSYEEDRGDTNAYTLGSIGCHNVVLAYMPNMGKTSAANVATHLSRSFPNIKLAIVVGICGVVPFSPVKKDEIILGDVIVSEGIIQYDFARRLPEGLVRKDSHQEALGRPPAEVRSILAKLKGRRGQQKWQNEMVTHLNKLQNDPGLKAGYPGAQNDKLFQASYRHRKDSLTCQQAGCQGTVDRHRLTQGITQPTIHFGLIGSADTVMKSGLERDVIANREKILGFEMESAGVWDTVPSCLVIKGACDYADSHKTKAWQQYAAATAAACTKAFLTIGYQRTRDHQ
ncbi:nucleoside phosphorylase domain-containing protein [Dactylonectria macrodidyma]|uniref:Nucleoside phosphorylase domain-containing protein n=1 Tax=Dactylonectria macrodidyma TaxID=307937 RepID=A0A9P9DLA8_9HYPO|nr:nucleoside phosphorylase domain-containing protein [Dactylonectria macrodidyma]